MREPWNVRHENALEGCSTGRRTAASSAVVLKFHVLSATLIVTPGGTTWSMRSSTSLDRSIPAASSFAARQPATGQWAVGHYAHSVAQAGRQHVVLDGAGQERVGGGHPNNELINYSALCAISSPTGSTPSPGRFGSPRAVPLTLWPDQCSNAPSRPGGSLPAMKTIGLMARTVRKKPPAAESAGALAALALICAGCGNPVPAGNSHNGKTGTLKVAVIEAGGPALPGGGTPKQRVANAEVKVTGARTSLSSRTGKAGVATFRLPSGSYLISSSTCGSTGKQKVTVTAAGSTSLTWWCPVP